ncbi:MAG: NAD(P)-dependent oxidoreductase [Propylenella sp.]
MARSRARIFLTHSTAARETWYGAHALTKLREVGEVILNPLDRPMTVEELVAAARDCLVIVSDREATGGAEVFAGLPDLVAYIRGQVDIRTVDVAAASAAGVLVTRASRGFMAAVAEWILGAMVMAARHSLAYAESYRRGEEPGFIVGRQLAGSTIGVIGFGAIGERLCESAHALGMRVLVHDPYRQAPAPFEQVELRDLFGQSDFVVPLAVATDATENLIDAAALAAMKPTTWLINASRGNLVDEAALERALDAGKIAGAALDVGRAKDQKPPLHLARRPDVIASPHIAGLTPEALEHQALETVRQAAAILRGEVPEGAVNADKAARLARLRQ